MNTKKIILSTIFLSSMISSISMFGMVKGNQQSNPPTVNEAAFFASSPAARITIAALFGSAVRLYWKESKQKPDYYDMQNLKKFLQVQNLVSNPEEYIQNLKDFVDNFIIGQLFKDKCIKLKSDNTVKQSKKCPQSGVGGNLASMISVSDKSQKMMKNIFKFAAALFTIDKVVFQNALVQYFLDREKPATGILNPYEDASLRMQERIAKAHEQNQEALLSVQESNAKAQEQHTVILQGVMDALEEYNKKAAAQPQTFSYVQPPVYSTSQPLYSTPQPFVFGSQTPIDPTAKQENK